MAQSGVTPQDGGARWALAVLAALLLQPEAAGATKYVVHYMPWFLGPESGHWCNPDWGNSFYDSVFGRYDVRDADMVRRQLQLMKAAGIDGIWFDFQAEKWIPRVQLIAEEALRQGLNFAVVADNYLDENVTNSLQGAIAGWMAMPNYYWVHGRPLLPIFEAPSRWQRRPTILPTWTLNGLRPFVVGTYHWHQRESEPLPHGYDSLFFWVSTDLLWTAKYHASARFSLKVGSVYRGWREAYRTWHHTAPYLGFLNSTLKIVQDNRPDFAQLVTWNDYTEGTMLEPSFLRGQGSCLDPFNTYYARSTASCNNQRKPFGSCTPGLWVPCSGSWEAPCSHVEDCSKPLAAVEGPGASGCPSATPAGTPLSAYYDLAMIASAALGVPIAQAIATFRAIVEAPTSTATLTSTTATTTTDTTPLLFEPATDGAGRACRGSTASDNSEAYYSLGFGAGSLLECQARCLREAGCTGVEHNLQQGRCEVWTATIGVKVQLSGFTCLLRRRTTTATAATAAATTTAFLGRGPQTTSKAATAAATTAAFLGRGPQTTSKAAPATTTFPSTHGPRSTIRTGTTSGPTSTTAALPSEGVEVDFTITGLDYTQVSRSQALTDGLTVVVRQAAVSAWNAGHPASEHVGEGDVTVALSAGSVRAQAVIVPPVRTAAASLVSDLQGSLPRLTTEVVSHVMLIPGIQSAATGGMIGLSDISLFTTHVQVGTTAASLGTPAFTAATKAPSLDSGYASGARCSARRSLPEILVALILTYPM